MLIRKIWEKKVNIIIIINLSRKLVGNKNQSKEERVRKSQSICSNIKEEDVNEESHNEYRGKENKREVKDIIHSKDKVSESKKNITKDNFRDLKSKYYLN